MKLRSGKVIYVHSDYYVKQLQIIDNIGQSRISSEKHNKLLLLKNIYILFRQIHMELTPEKVVDYFRYITTAYERSYTIMCQLVEMTYSHVHRPKTNKEKTLFVRAMLEIYRSQEYLSGLIIRHQVEMSECGYGWFNKKWDEERTRVYMNKLSLCLSHIHRVENDQLFYKVCEYGDNEYTEVEIFDYYFGGSYDNYDSDEFIQTTKKYFTFKSVI